MIDTDRPLVTFALFAYNQEEYIRDAIQGALSQTYSPLQIILSDDNSSDNTFTIMQEIASQYKGPHQITLNRNQSNQGIGGHINKLMLLTKGEFIVIAAGDDISMPERTVQPRVCRSWRLAVNRGSKISRSQTVIFSTNTKRFAAGSLNKRMGFTFLIRWIMEI